MQTGKSDPIFIRSCISGRFVPHIRDSPRIVAAALLDPPPKPALGGKFLVKVMWAPVFMLLSVLNNSAAFKIKLDLSAGI